MKKNILVLFLLLLNTPSKAVDRMEGGYVGSGGQIAVDCVWNFIKHFTYQLSDKNAVDEATAMNNATQLLTAMGEQLNFDLSSKMKESDRLFFMNKQDPSANCMVNLKSGDISANAGNKNYMNYGATPDLLKNEEAMRTAKQYIQQLKYADFNDAEIVPGHTGGVNMGSHDEQNRSQIFEKFHYRSFQPEIRQYSGAGAFSYHCSIGRERKAAWYDSPMGRL